MKQITITFIGLLLAVTGLWWLADPLIWSPLSWLALRDSLIAYTGLLAIGVMGAALLLAARPAQVEPWLGGLDTLYRLHKWPGITALVVARLHSTRHCSATCVRPA